MKALICDSFIVWFSQANRTPVKGSMIYKLITLIARFQK